MTERDIERYARASVVKPPRKKVFVFGPAGATNYPLVKTKLDRVTYWFDDVVVFLRSEAGFEDLVMRWANERYNRYFVYTYHPFPEVYGKDAPARRDELILSDLSREYNGVAVAFDDGKDEVVKYLRSLCEWHGTKVRILKYEVE